MNWHLMAVPLLSAFVGWITNVAAVRLLFWPIRPWRLPGLPWAVHGVIPKRQQEIARSVGEVVERLLLRPEDIVESLDGQDYQQEAAEILSRYVELRVEQGVSRYLPGAVRNMVTSYVKEAVRREAASATQAVLDRLRDRLKGQIRVAPVVAERVGKLDPAEFEAMLLRVIGRELRWLEILGGIMGFVIGLIQMAIVWQTA